MPDPQLLDDFLEALKRDGSPVHNPVLRETLGWPEAQYEEVKAVLAARRIVAQLVTMRASGSITRAAPHRWRARSGRCCPA